MCCNVAILFRLSWDWFSVSIFTLEPRRLHQGMAGPLIHGWSDVTVLSLSPFAALPSAQKHSITLFDYSTICHSYLTYYHQSSGFLLAPEAKKVLNCVFWAEDEIVMFRPVVMAFRQTSKIDGLVTYRFNWMRNTTHHKTNTTEIHFWCFSSLSRWFMNVCFMIR